jgi:hypothetical protein
MDRNVDVSDIKDLNFSEKMLKEELNQNVNRPEGEYKVIRLARKFLRFFLKFHATLEKVLEVSIL